MKSEFVCLKSHKFVIRSKEIGCIRTYSQVNGATGNYEYVIFIHSKIFADGFRLIFFDVDKMNKTVEYISQCCGFNNCDVLYLKERTDNETNNTKPVSSDNTENVEKPVQQPVKKTEVQETKATNADVPKPDDEKVKNVQPTEPPKKSVEKEDSKFTEEDIKFIKTIEIVATFKNKYTRFMHVKFKDSEFQKYVFKSEEEYNDILDLCNSFNVPVITYQEYLKKYANDKKQVSSNKTENVEKPKATNAEVSKPDGEKVDNKPRQIYNKGNFAIYSLNNNPDQVIIKHNTNDIKVDDIICIKLTGSSRTISILTSKKMYTTMISDKKQFNSAVGILYNELKRTNKTLTFNDNSNSLINLNKIKSFTVEDNGNKSIIHINIADNKVLNGNNIKLYYRYSINNKNGDPVRTDIERLVTYGVREDSGKELASEPKPVTVPENTDSVKVFNCNDSGKTEIDLEWAEAFASFRNAYTQYILVRYKGITVKLFYTYEALTDYEKDIKRFEDAGVNKLSWKAYIKRYLEV